MTTRVQETSESIQISTMRSAAAPFPDHILFLLYSHSSTPLNWHIHYECVCWPEEILKAIPNTSQLFLVFWHRVVRSSVLTLNMLHHTMSLHRVFSFAVLADASADIRCDITSYFPAHTVICPLKRTDRHSFFFALFATLRVHAHSLLTHDVINFLGRFAGTLVSHHFSHNRYICPLERTDHELLYTLHFSASLCPLSFDSTHASV